MDTEYTLAKYFPDDSSNNDFVDPYNSFLSPMIDQTYVPDVFVDLSIYDPSFINHIKWFKQSIYESINIFHNGFSVGESEPPDKSKPKKLYRGYNCDTFQDSHWYNLF